jgi:hypothetical protein
VKTRSLGILCAVVAVVGCGGDDIHVPASRFPLVPGAWIVATDEVPGVDGDALIRALLIVRSPVEPRSAFAREEERLLIKQGWNATNSHEVGVFAAQPSDGSIYLTMEAATKSTAEADFDRPVAPLLKHRHGMLLVTMVRQN